MGSGGWWPVQAVGRATVGLREERDCGHTSSPDTARCRQLPAHNVNELEPQCQPIRAGH